MLAKDIFYNLEEEKRAKITEVLISEFSQKPVYGHNQLNLVHTHNLAMGFLAIMVIYLVMRKYDMEKIQEIKKPFHLYVSSHVFSFVCMFVIGLSQVIGSFDKDDINIGGF